MPQEVPSATGSAQCRRKCPVPQEVPGAAGKFSHRPPHQARQVTATPRRAADTPPSRAVRRHAVRRHAVRRPTVRRRWAPPLEKGRLDPKNTSYPQDSTGRGTFPTALSPGQLTTLRPERARRTVQNASSPRRSVGSGTATTPDRVPETARTTPPLSPPRVARSPPNTPVTHTRSPRICQRQDATVSCQRYPQ